jgi:CheY-like chemotaxis protein
VNQPLALIVDDHGDSAVIFSEAMRIAGFAVEVIRSGDEALARLDGTPPDVIVLDMCLPRVAGTEILRRIRAEERLAHIYVIVVTADPAMAAVSTAADQVVVKPIGFRWLRDLAFELAGRFGAKEEATS